MRSHPKTPVVLSFAALLVLIAANSVCAQSRYFKNWPAGALPREVGTRVAKNYLARQFEYQQGKRQYVIYPEVCAGYGSLTVAELTKNKELKNQLLQKFETLWSAEGQKHVSRKRTLITAFSELFHCNCICRRANRSIWTWAGV